MVIERQNRPTSRKNNSNRILPYLYFSLTDDGDSITDTVCTDEEKASGSKIELRLTHQVCRGGRKLFRCPRRLGPTCAPACRVVEHHLFLLFLPTIWTRTEKKPWLRIESVGSETGTLFFFTTNLRQSRHHPTMTSPRLIISDNVYHQSIVQFHN